MIMPKGLGEVVADILAGRWRLLSVQVEHFYKFRYKFRLDIADAEGVAAAILFLNLPFIIASSYGDVDRSFNTIH